MSASASRRRSRSARLAAPAPGRDAAPARLNALSLASSAPNNGHADALERRRDQARHAAGSPRGSGSRRRSRHRRDSARSPRPRRPPSRSVPRRRAPARPASRASAARSAVEPRAVWPGSATPSNRPMTPSTMARSADAAWRVTRSPACRRHRPGVEVEARPAGGDGMERRIDIVRPALEGLHRHAAARERPQQAEPSPWSCRRPSATPPTTSRALGPRRSSPAAPATTAAAGATARSRRSRRSAGEPMPCACASAASEPSAALDHALLARRRRLDERRRRVGRQAALLQRRGDLGQLRHRHVEHDRLAELRQAPPSRRPSGRPRRDGRPPARRHGWCRATWPECPPAPPPRGPRSGRE